MFNKTEIWLKNSFYLHKWKKNIHKSLSKQIHFTRYHIGNIHTIHAKTKQPRRTPKTYTRLQGTYYAHCCQLTTKPITRSCEGNKLYNQ